VFLPTNNQLAAESTWPEEYRVPAVPELAKPQFPVMTSWGFVPFIAGAFRSDLRHAMRKLLFLLLVLGILWALDLFGFNGRYSSAIWLDANDQAHAFNYQAQRWVQKLTGA